MGNGLGIAYRCMMESGLFVLLQARVNAVILVDSRYVSLVDTFVC